MNIPADLESILDEQGYEFFTEEIPEDMQGWKVSYVVQEGGEGQGDEYWIVYSFEKGEQKILVKFQGSYCSYSGREYADYKVVTAQEKTITVYE